MPCEFAFYQFKKIILICVLNDPKKFQFFIENEYPKYAEFYIDFKSVEIIGKKSNQKKLFAKKFCKLVVGIEEDSLQFSTLFLPITFLLAHFHSFLNRFEISEKFCVVLITILRFCEEKVFRSYLHFFEPSQPNSQETAQKLEKCVLQQCLRITFYTYIQVLRIRDSVPFCPLDPGSGMGKKSGSGSGLRIRDEQPGSYFLELRNNFFGLQYFFDADPGSGMEKIRIRDPGWKKFGSGIRDGKKLDPG